jgi:hypothetical protein
LQYFDRQDWGSAGVEDVFGGSAPPIDSAGG